MAEMVHDEKGHCTKLGYFEAHNFRCAMLLTWQICRRAITINKTFIKVETVCDRNHNQLNLK